MIQALMHYKSHINLIEDEKTSMIIGTLLHLPADLMLEVIFNAIENKPDTLEEYLQKIKHLQKMPEFWPHWPAKGTSNDNHVEPDVFMRFSSFDLIIEAKRNDDKTSQLSDQLRKELIAYGNKYDKEKKKVFLIALGGNTDDISKLNKEERNRILPCSWKDLLYSIERKKSEARTNKEDYADDVVYRILSDCTDAFRVFSHTTGWLHELCDLEYKPIDKKSIENIRLWEM